MMNLLCVSHTIDIINYGMLKAIQAKGFNTYVTYTTEDEHKAIPKDITGIEVPYFRKKFNWPTIQCIRKIIKTIRSMSSMPLTVPICPMPYSQHLELRLKSSVTGVHRLKSEGVI